MQVEVPNLHPQNYPCLPPPYTSVDHQAVNNTGPPSLPAPVVTQPTAVALSQVAEFQRYRQQVICPSCHQEIVTKTEYRVSGGTWCMCCVVFFVGGFLCCFIPFLMKSCKDVVHRCPDCGVEIGRKPII